MTPELVAKCRAMVDKSWGSQLTHAYAEGRKDEREEIAKLFREEAAAIRKTGQGCHDARYDWMAAGVEAAMDALQGIDSATGKPAA